MKPESIVVIGLIVSVIAMCIVFPAMYLYCGGCSFDTKLISKHVVVSELTPGIPSERNPGFIDTEGNGYILLYGMLTVYEPVISGEYNIKYFCGSNDNLRKVIDMEFIPTATITPEAIPEATRDLAKCKIVDGECV